MHVQIRTADNFVNFNLFALYPVKVGFAAFLQNLQNGGLPGAVQCD